MSWRGLNEFRVKLHERQKAIVDDVGAAVLDSIQNGSAVTGAPGQPVDTGNLRASWYRRYESPAVQVIATNTEYAPDIEDNARGATLRSEVGGFHSVRLTRNGFSRLVDDIVRRLSGA